MHTRVACVYEALLALLLAGLLLYHRLRGLPPLRLPGAALQQRPARGPARRTPSAYSRTGGWCPPPASAPPLNRQRRKKQTMPARPEVYTLCGPRWCCFFGERQRGLGKKTTKRKGSLHRAQPFNRGAAWWSLAPPVVLPNRRRGCPDRTRAWVEKRARWVCVRAGETWHYVGDGKTRFQAPNGVWRGCLGTAETRGWIGKSR